MKKRNLKDIVVDEIRRVLNSDFILEKPKDIDMAHYATPLAFALAKELKKAPKNKVKKSIKIFNKMAKNITFPRPTNKTAE